MAEDEGLADEGQVAFEDVEVGAADSAGEDAEEDVAGGEGRVWGCLRLERLVGGVEDGGFHQRPRDDRIPTIIVGRLIVG